MRMDKDQLDIECKSSRLLSMEFWGEVIVEEFFEKEKFMKEVDMRYLESLG